MKFQIVKSKAVGGFSAKIEGMPMRFSRNDALRRYMICCSLIGESVVKGLRPRARDIREARDWKIVHDELDNAIKTVIRR